MEEGEQPQPTIDTSSGTFGNTPITEFNTSEQEATPVENQTQSEKESAWESASILENIAFSEPVSVLDAAPDGKIVVGHPNDHLSIADREHHRLPLKGRFADSNADYIDKNITALKISGDGTIISASAAHILQFHKLNTGELIGSFATQDVVGDSADDIMGAKRNQVTSIDVLKNGKVLTADRWGAVAIYDPVLVDKNAPDYNDESIEAFKRHMQKAKPFSSMGANSGYAQELPDGKIVATRGNGIRILDGDTLKTLSSIEPIPQNWLKRFAEQAIYNVHAITALTVSADGMVIFAQNETIKILNPKNGKITDEHTLTSGSIIAHIAITNDGMLAIGVNKFQSTSQNASSAVIYNPETHTKLTEVELGEKWIRGLTVDEDNHILAASGNKVVKIG